MIEIRTDALISAYMRWTNKKVLTPEEFLLFRKQAVEEEMNGVPEPAGASQGGFQARGEERTANREPVTHEPPGPRKVQNSAQPTDIGKSHVNVLPTVEHKPSVEPVPVGIKKEIEKIKENQESKEVEKRKENNNFGMSDDEFLAFMKSVDD